MINGSLGKMSIKDINAPFIDLYKLLDEQDEKSPVGAVFVTSSDAPVKRRVPLALTQERNAYMIHVESPQLGLW